MPLSGNALWRILRAPQKSESDAVESSAPHDGVFPRLAARAIAVNADEGVRWASGTGRTGFHLR